MNLQQSMFLATLFTITLCSAYYVGGEGPLLDRTPHVYCGRSLSIAIDLMCELARTKGYNKRSDSGSMYNAILSPYYKEQDNQVGWPWMAPQNAKSMSVPSRGKRLVVDECCHKACTTSEMVAYCAEER